MNPEMLNRLFIYANTAEVKPHAELVKRDGKIHPSARTGSVIVAAIKTADMTTTDMGQILNAITGRICSATEDYPELEETSCDLSATCELYEEAMRKTDERLATLGGADNWCAENE